ncbi:hypothetical protein PPTG_05701 [Phytophthora nicotianae INRA-310]|uniref:Uncharacterized protein n=1 Tax=Phytophthora nicotianae (strain INRA-310) TaxID=761204 RepID=W2QTI2_PHYN3|nr:hypothetical protein PPTG_05701 [Phytophthora nicotianae INRA-310]ETN16502.1 hypothetical protein PPTG_05701 [Phytophthora nicotianae INRA-310]
MVEEETLGTDGAAHEYAEGSPRNKESASSPLCTRSNPALKRTHSLDISDLARENPGNSDASAGSMDTEEHLDAELVNNEEMHFDWLPELVSTDAGVLDEIVAVSPRPNFPPRIKSSPRQPPAASSRSLVQKRRISRKEQIQVLRKKVTELSQNLQNLRTVLFVDSFPSSLTTCAASSITWKSVASRQLKLRRKAENENAKLRELKMLQSRTIRNFRRMVHRRKDDELLRNLRNAKAKRQNLDNEHLFAELLHGLDNVYAGLDKLYEEKAMSAVPCPGRKRLVHTNAADGTPFLEFRDKNLVPFSVDRTANAVWTFLQGSKGRKGKRVCWQDTQQTTNTCISRVGFTCTGIGLASYVLERRVSRKYVEKNRTVFISRTIIEPTTEEHWTSSVRFSETMATVVRAGSLLSSGQETAIIESHISSSKCCDPIALQRWPLYLKATADGWESKISFYNQEIENVLFEGAICSK